MLIFLVGYMACGKSTIGRKLKKALDIKLYDTDNEIVNREGVTVSEIFSSKGEEYFRACESAVISDIISGNVDAIVSTGGGLPVWGDNMQVMNNAGVTIYISRTAENIASRISPYGREKRPKLRGLNDEELINVMREGIAERDEYYRQAQLIIEADKYSDEMILNAITSYIKTL